MGACQINLQRPSLMPLRSAIPSVPYVICHHERRWNAPVRPRSLCRHTNPLCRQTPWPVCPLPPAGRCTAQCKVGNANTHTIDAPVPTCSSGSQSPHACCAPRPPQQGSHHHRRRATAPPSAWSWTPHCPFHCTVIGPTENTAGYSSSPFLPRLMPSGISIHTAKARYTVRCALTVSSCRPCSREERPDHDRRARGAGGGWRWWFQPATPQGVCRTRVSSRYDAVTRRLPPLAGGIMHEMR